MRVDEEIYVSGTPRANCCDVRELEGFAEKSKALISEVVPIRATKGCGGLGVS